MISEGFGLTGKWLEATERIIRTMTGSIDPRDLELPLGASSELGIERYAREYCAASGRASLAIIYPIAAVGVCTATQGAWELLCPLKGGGWLPVPPIHYAAGIAPSGARKSTALDAARKPLQRALAAGERARIERMAQLRAAAERFVRERVGSDDGPAAGARLEPKQFAVVFNAGVCPVTIVKDPTMEALGHLLATNGATASIWSAEADVFRSMIAYNPDGGSLTPLLDGWSQEGISTTRVGRGHIEMPDAALNLMVLFQPQVFADITGGTSSRAGGGDSWIDRGMLARMWVARATDLGGYEQLAQLYADDQDFEYHGPDGMTLATGEMTPLGAALADYEQSLRDLVSESNFWRSQQAIHRQWKLGLIEHGADFQVPEPELPKRHQLHLDRAGRLAYRRVQRMQLAIESALADDTVDEDIRAVFTPLAARITQHIMREAVVVSLGAGYRDTVPAVFIEDAALRLIPWRVSLTADALLARAVEITEEAVVKSAQANPRGEDLTVDGVILRRLAKLAMREPGERNKGFTRGQVRDGVRSQLLKVKGTGVGMGQLVADTLDRLAADRQSGVKRIKDSVGGHGEAVARYTIDDAAIGAHTR